MGVLTDSVTDLIVLSFEIVIVITMVSLIIGFLGRFTGLNEGRRR